MPSASRLDEVLPTAGAAEAFGLIARARAARRPVVVHPQFTEPDVALAAAGHHPEHVLTDPASGFVLDPSQVPDDADLVMIGNPTNPTSVLHPDQSLRRLVRPGRVVVVDEAFMDSVPDERHSLAAITDPGLLVVRSLTKLWSIPGVRAGYVLGSPQLLAELKGHQAPWSVSTAAIAAMIATATPEALAEAAKRTTRIGQHRRVLTDGLTELGIHHVPAAAPYVLAKVGTGAHERLRAAGTPCAAPTRSPASTTRGYASPCANPTRRASSSPRWGLRGHGPDPRNPRPRDRRRRPRRRPGRDPARAPAPSSPSSPRPSTASIEDLADRGLITWHAREAEHEPTSSGPASSSPSTPTARRPTASSTAAP